ncbi:glycosyltransferase family 2 protein [Candidatus Giovannonibacteria bacterium]|nr:glycosyltransferase family 2 protein [Candidatus Giovannonibacteria bacterium]
MKLSVVLPCFNEETNVPRIGPELLPVLDKITPDFEVIVVDDGSTDRTAQLVDKMQNPKVRLIEHGVNKGLAQGVRTGLAAATGEYIIFLDSDFTFHPNLIPKLFEALEKNPGADFVVGSPNLAKYDENIPAWRIFIAKAATLVYSLLLGKPTTSINPIFRLYKTRQLKELALEAGGFEINAEILFKLVFRGRKFVEIPAELTQRQYGVSKMNYPREIRRHFFLILKILKWKFIGGA